MGAESATNLHALDASTAPESTQIRPKAHDLQKWIAI